MQDEKGEAGVAPKMVGEEAHPLRNPRYEDGRLVQVPEHGVQTCAKGLGADFRGSVRFRKAFGKRLL